MDHVFDIASRVALAYLAIHAVVFFLKLFRVSALLFVATFVVNRAYKRGGIPEVERVSEAFVWPTWARRLLSWPGGA